ncbi:MAG: DNA repair and recombination protein RadB [Candidatus Thermoplasmatota archaeon]|jgi:DNA repair protein RadB|nr:DNA repair and recombination protein RadB [Candidatus Thermoplasmatota archaeon]
MERIDATGEVTRIKSGISCLDSVLSGGLEKKIISEIYGEGGSGKTNLSLLISLSVVASGGTAVYLDTEGVSTERIRQLTASMKGDLKKLYLYRIKSLEDQELTLLRIEKNIDRGQTVPELIVIDSFTEYFRLEKSSDPSGRTATMQKHMAILMSIISKSDCAVLITNQIYQDVQTGNLEPFGGYVIDHSVKAIFRISKLPESKRKMEVLKHRSEREGHSMYFRITSFGIECLQS